MPGWSRSASRPSSASAPMRMFAAVILAGLDPLLADPARRASRRVLLAVPTGFFAFRLQGAYFAIGTWVHRRSRAAGRSPSGRRSAAAPALAAARGDRATCSASTPIATLVRRARRRRRRDILTYWLALVAGHRRPSASSTGCCAPAAASALAAVRDNQEAARSVGVDAARMKCARLSRRPPSAPASPAR